MNSTLDTAKGIRGKKESGGQQQCSCCRRLLLLVTILITKKPLNCINLLLIFRCARKVVPFHDSQLHAVCSLLSLLCPFPPEPRTSAKPSPPPTKIQTREKDLYYIIPTAFYISSSPFTCFFNIFGSTFPSLSIFLCFNSTF